jgi:hypothetical protein
VAALPQTMAYEFLFSVVKARQSTDESKRVQKLRPEDRYVD